MKLSSLFKSPKKSSFSPLLCRLPHCGNPRTLSFRVENNHNIFNSQKFYNNVDDDMVDEVIEGLKIEKERFFFEASEKTSSILDVSSSTRPKSTNNSTSSNRLEYPPLNDSMDAYGIKTSPILEGSSSTLLSKNNSSNELEYICYQPFNDSWVLRVTSRDPYGYIKKRMERVVEENQGIKDWKESLEEICAWHLENNYYDKNIHKFIIGAFCDLWMSYSGISTTNTPFGFSTSEPPSPYFMSLIEAKADQIIAASTSSVIS